MSPRGRCAVLTLVALCMSAGSAGAVSGPIASAPVLDGSVSSILVDGSGRAYVGGDFHRVGPRVGHGVVLTTSSDTPAPALPDINGDIDAAVADGSGGWYIGGAFTSVGGVTRNRIARLGADLSVDPTFNPGANNVVRSLMLSGGSLYVGGSFTAIGGVSRSRIAKLDPATGAVDISWAGGTGTPVNALAVVGGYLYAGGDGPIGSGINGALGRFEVATGAPDPSFMANALGPVWALAVSGTTLYAGGGFFGAGTGAHSADHLGLAKLDTTITGANPVDDTWAPQSNALGSGTGVRTMLLSGADLVIGGDFSAISVAGGPGALRFGVAKLSATGTGTVDPSWHPDAYGSVRSLALSGDDLMVGGSFTQLGAQTHASLGKVSLATGATSPTWNPNPGASVYALAFSGSSLFAGGSFASAGPQNIERNSLLRLNADGTLDSSFNPNVNGQVLTMALSGSNLYIGGTFNTVGGTTHPQIARISTDTGALDNAWAPVVDGPEVDALLVSGGSVYVGGQFVDIGGTPRSNLARINVSDGGLDTTWAPNAGPGNVRALVMSGTSLIAGGAFSGFNPAGGPPPETRFGIAKISTTDAGTVDHNWDPNASGIVTSLALSGSDLFVGGSFNGIGGQARRGLAKISTTGTGLADPFWDPSANSTVFGLALDGDKLYAAGQFSLMGGVARAGLARVPTTGVGATDAAFVPAVANGPVLAVAPLSASRLLVGGAFTALGSASLSGIGLYDLTAPSTAITMPVEAGRYPQGKSITAAYSCSDPDGAANVTSCAGPVANGAPFDTSTPGPRTFTATATDAGGDTATQTVNYVVDGSLPTIGLTAPAQGDTYTKGQVVKAAYGCADIDGAGDVATCTGPVASGAAIDTSTGGPHTFTVTATDAAGNQATSTVTYTVKVLDLVAPVMTGFKILPATFRAASSGASAAAKKRPTGARVTYRLSEAATLVVTVLQPRKKKKPVSLGYFTVKGKPGANHFKFTGRFNGGKLAPGRYRLSAQSIDAAGNFSKVAVASFRIVRR